MAGIEHAPSDAGVLGAASPGVGVLPIVGLEMGVEPDERVDGGAALGIAGGFRLNSAKSFDS
jgi:hypothetical protein